MAAAVCTSCQSQSDQSHSALRTVDEPHLAEYCTLKCSFKSTASALAWTQHSKLND